MTGTWFIQTLCKVLRENAMGLSMLQLSTKVNNCISKRCEEMGNGEIASLMSNMEHYTLRKELYFFPENYVGSACSVGSSRGETYTAGSACGRKFPAET